MRKTITNMLFNGMYQIFSILIPIITVPYISRRLGSYYLGEFSYFNSFCVFLGAIILFGLGQFGTKLMAESDLEKRSSIFFNLWSLQISIGVIVTSFFFVYMSISPKQNVFVLFLPLILSYFIDLSWFYIGIAEIKKVVARNTLVKVMSIILIFILVKSESDFPIYIVINTVGNLVANLFFVFSLPKYIDFKYKKFHPFNKPYIKSGLILLIPQIAVQVYTNLDKVVVGGIAGSVQLSYYDQSQKIARIVLALVGSVSLVLMPKMAKEKENKKLFNQIFNLSLDGTLLVAVLLSAIVAVNTKEFVPWFFGSEFSPMVSNMVISSIIIIFISYGGVFANQYALSMGYFKIFAVPYVVGAITNISLNLTLVPTWNSVGASISLVITEAMVCFLRVFLLRKKLNIGAIIFREGGIIVAAVVSVLLLSLVRVNLESVLFTMIVNSVLLSFFFIVVILVISSTYRHYLKSVISGLIKNKNLSKKV